MYINDNLDFLIFESCRLWTYFLVPLYLGSVHYLGTWEEYRIPREGYRIPDTSDGRGREFPTHQMGGVQNSSASREGHMVREDSLQ